MGETIEQKPVLPEQKKKKRHIGLKIFIIILVVVIVLPVSLAYILLFDGNSKTVNIDQTATQQSIGKEILVDCLDDTEHTQKLSVQLSERQLNHFLNFATSGMDTNFKKYFPKLYIDINAQTDEYTFYLDLRVPLFASRARIRTKLVPGGDKFMFDIKEVGAGRLNGLEWVVKKYVKPEMIDDIFTKAGLHIKADLENMRLTYSYTDLLSDIKTLMGAGGTDNVFFNLLEEFIAKGNINVLTYEDTENNYKALAFDFDLIECSTNQYTNANYEFDYDYDPIVDPVVTKLNNGEVLPNDTDVTNALTSKFKECYPKQAVDIKQKIIDNLPSGPYALETEYKVKLYESDINDYLGTTRAVPTFFPLYRIEKFSDNTQSYKLNFVSIDNLYADFFVNQDSEEEADFVMNLNMNNFHCPIGIHTIVNDSLSTNNKLAFVVEDVELGQNTLTGGLVDKFMDIAARSFDGSGSPSLSLTKDTTLGKYVLSIDFKDMISDYIKSQVPVIPGFTTTVDTSSELYGTKLDDDIEDAGLEFSFTIHSTAD